MARTTGEKVKQVITTSVEAEAMTPFITIANQLVTEVIGTSLTVAVLEEIERWLAAHFLAVSLEKQSTIDKMGDAERTYQGRTGMDLKSTLYGQTACLLDTTRNLDNLLRRPSSIRHIKPDLGNEFP